MYATYISSSRSPRTPGRSPGGESVRGEVGDDGAAEVALVLQDPPKGRSPNISQSHSPSLEQQRILTKSGTCI